MKWQTGVTNPAREANGRIQRQGNQHVPFFYDELGEGLFQDTKQIEGSKLKNMQLAGSGIMQGRSTPRATQALFSRVFSPFVEGPAELSPGFALHPDIQAATAKPAQSAGSPLASAPVLPAPRPSSYGSVRRQEAARESSAGAELPRLPGRSAT